MILYRRGDVLDAVNKHAVIDTESVKVERLVRPGLYVVSTRDGRRFHAEVQAVMVLIEEAS